MRQVQELTMALYCILFLHQTTTPPLIRYTPQRCIASSFYIKPQHAVEHLPLPHVVLHPLSTSNHNCPRHGLRDYSLYCILFLHQTTTSLFDKAFPSLLYCILFLHQTTTSIGRLYTEMRLYCILFLHQTTTRWFTGSMKPGLYCILFLHQTTTYCGNKACMMRCIASSFYIKPQRTR